MISSALKRWQQSRNYRIDGDTVYGVAAGVGFSVAEEDGGKLVIFMLSGEDSAFDNIEDQLIASPTELNQVQVGDVESYLALFFDESNGAMPDTVLDELLEFVGGNYRSCGFRVPNKCVVCGERASKRAFRDGMVQPMCANCREAEKSKKRAVVSATPNLSDEPETARPLGGSKYEDYDEYGDEAMQAEVHKRTAEKFAQSDFGPPEKPMRNVAFDAYNDYDDDYKEPGSVEGSTGKGVLGAFLGALAGLLPFVITVVLGYPVAGLAFIASMLSVNGYIAFGGLRKKSTSVGVIVALSELVAIIGVVCSVICLTAKDYGSFAAASGYFFSEPVELIVHLVLATLGVLLGFSLSSIKLGKYLDGEK